jgi:hypothetical protein
MACTPAPPIYAISSGMCEGCVSAIVRSRERGTKFLARLLNVRSTMNHLGASELDFCVENYALSWSAWMGHGWGHAQDRSMDAILKRSVRCVCGVSRKVVWLTRPMLCLCAWNYVRIPDTIENWNKLTIWVGFFGDLRHEHARMSRRMWLRTINRVIAPLRTQQYLYKNQCDVLPYTECLNVPGTLQLE